MDAAPQKNIENQALSTLYGAPEGQDARILARLADEAMREDKVCIHVALDAGRMASLAELLAFFAPEAEIVQLPAWDCLPYDRVSPNAEVVAQRVAALTTLLRWQEEKKRYPRILLTSVNAITQKLPPRSAFQQGVFEAQKGKPFKQEQFESFVKTNGYTRTDTVREAGEYAIRGGIIDIFPSGAENPYRLDLFGEEIESLKTFDAVGQTTIEAVDGFALYPVAEFRLDEDSIQRFRKGYREAFGVMKGEDPLYEAVSAGRRFNGMEHWLPLFHEGMATLFDYVPSYGLTLDAQTTAAIDERLSQIEDFYQARKSLEKASKDASAYHPLPVASLYGEPDLEGAQVFSPFGAPHLETPRPSAAQTPSPQGEGKTGRDFADIRALPDGDVFGEVKLHLKTLQAQGRKTLIATYSHGARERMKGLLEAASITPIVFVETLKDMQSLQPGAVGLVILGLEHGFVADDVAIVSEQDILGDRLARKAKKRRKADNFIRELSSIEVGDLVVHMDHGIGRFEGLETLDIGGAKHDCLKLVYAGDDKLFLPVENLEVLSRFGSDEGIVQLDRLGGAGWQSRKAKVKKDLMEMAEGLLGVAAARALNKADILSVPDHSYHEFVARFPYHETEDQLSAIEATQDDLAKGQPMDRLVCGDVGFGKTEVAIRAAFIAAMDGAQVAVVAPTTLLARQHFENFKKRFQGFGLRIEQLSRMVSAKDAKSTKEGLADGSVNIVIGTHAIFGSGIKFNNLGLVVVDEEQRFGVKQKERLKDLKKNVHVLTLTATPIPRTLQMALTGVRDMSIIASPPVDRLAVRTFVLPFDPMVIREAILREHYRGGQTFYVCPRVKDMPELEEKLKELVPEVKVITAHGQMPPEELEDRMTAFYDGQYEVLLATNIIESGLDVPSANTMIVHRADMFGLSQLYQIRGRVGRSKVRAYAYLTHEPGLKLNPQAQKRLEVLEQLDTLGSGFQLASHDLDIRGAGNLLGDAQSGHIKEIGVELYQQMLEEAVAEARAAKDDSAEAHEDSWSPQINIGVSVMIPENYVPDLNVRMTLYRRLSELESKDEIETFAAEMIDRFGKLPDEVENLLSITEIKQMCKAAHISRLDAGQKGVLISFYNNQPHNPEKLLAWIAARPALVKLRPDQKLSVNKQWTTAEMRVKGLKSVLGEITTL